jgi:hypothetical protein
MLIKEKGIKGLNAKLNYISKSTRQGLSSRIVVFNKIIKQFIYIRKNTQYKCSIIYHENSYKSKYQHVIKRNKLVNNNPWISCFYKNK